MTETAEGDPPGEPILECGDTCWRVAKAGRASVLVDAASYYQALRDCLKKAEKTVFIVGWDVDSRTRLVGPTGETEDGLPQRLGPFLTELVARRPDLRIYILLWDYSMLYALEREPLPAVRLAWSTPPEISVCLDDVLPVGASHHQKIVVIDDAVAFSGGLDLTIRRWDTPAHEIGDERRVDPAGTPYRPFHDMQMVVDGAAARLLGEVVRQRWRDAACETLAAAEGGDGPWPDGVAPDFTDIDVGLARTAAPYDGNPEIREVEALYRRSIEAAEHTIYIESQFLTADSVATCLAKRLEENQDLEVLMVGPNVHHSWLEERSMNAGRLSFMKRLKESGAADRVRLLYPAVPDDPTGEGVMVHAKFMIVDDRFLRVGSANLNNRSMGMDTECDLALVAGGDDHRGTIERIRNSLLAEHLGIETKDVAEAVDKHSSLLAAVDSLVDGDRTLRPIDLSGVPEHDLTQVIGRIADPERPIETPTFAGDLFGGTGAADKGAGRLVKLFGLALLVLGFAALWRYTPLSDYADPETLVGTLKSFSEDLWMPLVIPLLFLIGGLVAFPVTVLIVVVGMLFDPLAAFIYALGSALLSALATFFIGQALGRSTLRDLMGKRVNRLSREMAKRGVLSVAAVRMLPIAPFTVINLVAGASHVRVWDYLLGTIAGMAPGILVISLLGYQIGSVLSDPTPGDLAMLGLGLAGWLLLSFGLQTAAKRLRGGRDD